MRFAGALLEALLEDLLEALLEDLAGEADFFFLSGDCRGIVSSPGGVGGWSKALLALLAPLKVWHLTKFWDDRG